MTIILAEIIPRYDGYIIDLCGVIHNGKELYPWTNDTIQSLRNNGKHLIFLSNNPKPSSHSIESLKKMGFVWQGEEIITSGDLVRYQLANKEDEIFSNFGDKFFLLAGEKIKISQLI